MATIRRSEPERDLEDEDGMRLQRFHGAYGGGAEPAGAGGQAERPRETTAAHKPRGSLVVTA